MTAKEFVQSKMSDMNSEKHVSGKIKGMQKTYWLIRQKYNTMYFAEGETESKAWKNAKERILRHEQE